MDIEQMRIRMGEMAAEIERLNSAWQVETLSRKDLIIAKQESENDRLKAENARLQSIIDELQKRFMDASVDRNLLQGVINEQQSPAVSVPELDYVDGDILPPVGASVAIHLASCDKWVDHTVVGYYVWGPLGGIDSSYSRVFVRVLDDQGILNARILKDVKWDKNTPARQIPSPRITEHVAVPDHCLKKQNLPIEKLLEQYTHEGCDFTDIKWVNSASLRYVESMEDSQIKCLICSLINLQSLRITDKDAGEILLSYGVEYIGILQWLKDKGRATLDKLNEANHETN